MIDSVHSIQGISCIENKLIETLSGFVKQTVDSKSTINSLKDAGMDSLDVFEAVITVEEFLGISVPDSVLENDNETIEQLASNIYNSTLQPGGSIN